VRASGEFKAQTWVEWQEGERGGKQAADSLAKCRRCNTTDMPKSYVRCQTDGGSPLTRYRVGNVSPKDY